MEVRNLNYWTPWRRTLRSWFERNAPSLGELYEGALHMIFSDAFPGRVRFVAHAVREIRNRLPDVIAGPKTGTRLDYKSRLDDIQSRWERHGLPLDGSIPTRVSEEDTLPSNSDISVPYVVVQLIANLIRDHQQTRERQDEAAKRLFEAIDPNNRVSEATLRPRIENWLKITEWFVKRAHDRGQPDAEIGDNKLKNCFETFEYALSAMVGEFYKTVEGLDEILEEANPEQVDRAVALLVYAEQYRYFFDRLENPEWLEPLRQKGFFRHPPQPIQNEKEGTVRFPPWPEARYLARMASHKPDPVAEIIQEMEDTDNAAALCDLLDALLAMPPHVSARRLEKVAQWAERPYLYLLLPEKLGQLVEHWAKSGQTEGALHVARVLLDVLPEERRAGTGPNEEYRLPPEPKARFDTWSYEEILKKHYPELVKAAGLPALELLCDLLEKAIELSRTRADDQGLEDYSCIWRPAIEEHEQNRRDTIKDALVKAVVTAVRDAAEFIVQSGHGTTEEVVNALEQRRWEVFRRIALHVLRVFADQALPLIAARLTDRNLFGDVRARHEYVLLMRSCFSRLAEKDQAQILGWIEAGPEIERLKERRLSQGSAPTDEEVTRYREAWQRDRLAWIGPENLPAEWQERYGELVRKYGEPKHPEFPVYREGGGVGPISPKTAEELKAMSVREIVEFIKVWIPPESPFGEPSREGFGRVLSSVVTEEPERFASEAARFQGLDPTYVQAFLSGLEEGLKHGRAFDWGPVLNLCQWVLAQPRKIAGPRAEPLDADADRGWIRWVMARLLSAGFDEGPGSIPIRLREKVWHILKPLTEDPDPTPEQEERYGGSNTDLVELAMNTTRGQAMHAVVRYALWVRRHMWAEGDAEDHPPGGFDAMPEVREVLDAHLDVAQEPSLAIRAVYGQWFPWLVHLDSDWARDNSAKIFPTDQGKEAFFEAAWDAYIILCGPYGDVLDILQEQYRHAVERIGCRRDDTRWPANPEERLAEHLMAFYWRGKLSLEDPLLTAFWEKAPDAIRGHAIGYVGHALQQTSGEIPAEVLERLKQLWTSRLKRAQQSWFSTDFVKEMAGFGWWFVSDKFDVGWAIAQLSESLQLAHQTDPEYLLLERLAVTVETHPVESVQCLRMFAEGDREGWTLFKDRGHIRMILEVALRNPTAREKVERVINYLGSRGFMEFRDLLGGERHG